MLLVVISTLILKDQTYSRGGSCGQARIAEFPVVNPFPAFATHMDISVGQSSTAVEIAPSGKLVQHRLFDSDLEGIGKL
jgi:hypothetical protein